MTPGRSPADLPGTLWCTFDIPPEDGMAQTLQDGCNGAINAPAPRNPHRRHEESAVRTVNEPALSLLSRLVRKSQRSPRMRRPSALPTIYPTRSSYLQRLIWLFGGHR